MEASNWALEVSSPVQKTAWNFLVLRASLNMVRDKKESCPLISSSEKGGRIKHWIHFATNLPQQDITNNTCILNLYITVFNICYYIYILYLERNLPHNMS